jgi:hypothetical protein
VRKSDKRVLTETFLVLFHMNACHDNVPIKKGSNFNEHLLYALQQIPLILAR